MFQVQVKQDDGSWLEWAASVSFGWAEAFASVAKYRFYGQEIRIVPINQD